MDTRIIYTITDILSCLLFLLGLIAGIFALMRKNKMMGILSIVGFALLGFDVALRILIWRILVPNLDLENYSAFDWTYACAGNATFVLGIIALVVGIFLLGRRKVETPSEEPLTPEPPAT